MTEKRHLYPAGTVNVETGNLATKQDINYYNAAVQSATKAIVRFQEDMGKRFDQDQIYDGLAVSNGGATVDVASGTVKIGGRWNAVDAVNISAAVADGDYNVILEFTPNSEVSTRDPSTGESIAVVLELSGSWVSSDFKFVVGGANITSSTVNSVENRAKRTASVNIIKPYGTATAITIYTGTEPIYRKAIEFTADKIIPNNPINSVFEISGSAIRGGTLNVDGNSILNGISGTAISGTTLDITGQTNLGATNIGAMSGTTIGATSYQIGSEVLDISEFQNLTGLDQPLDTTQVPSFSQVQSTVATGTPPFIVASTTVIPNLNADQLDGQDAPVGTIVGTSDDQILSNKVLETPVFDGATIVSGSLTVVDNGATVNISDFLAIGSGSAQWRASNAPFTVNATNGIAGVSYGGGAVEERATNVYGIITAGNGLIYSMNFDLEPTRAGLDLYISGYRMIIHDADASNYMYYLKAIGLATDGGSALIHDNGATTYISSGTVEITFTGVDASSFSNVGVSFWAQAGSDRKLKFTPSQIKYYYA